MYLTMNRFKVRADKTQEFEARWEGGQKYLDDAPGFVEFHLLKGPQSDGQVLYASHTIWTDQASFQSWTKSDAFKQAHKGGGKDTDLYEWPPALEIFESVAV